MKWLYARVVAETVMRLAGLYGIASDDKARLEELLVSSSSGLSWLQEHELMKLVQPEDAGGLQDYLEPCFAALKAYQARGAEALCDAYTVKRR
jgi:hypothetical protein